MGWVPTVVENEGGNRERAFDIYSRLLRDRIVIVGRPIDDVVANLIVAQLIFLAAEDPDKEVQMYVNSPGGAVAAGMAIYDTMQYVKPPISTVAVGRTASFGTVLLMGGAKGKRFALPNARILMHQPSAGLGGSASDIRIQAEQLLFTKNRMAELIAEHSGQSLDQILRDSDRDRWFSAEEAREYGLLDQVMDSAAGVPGGGGTGA
jgi:ATP-dependent Clp protease protease subunit